MISGSLMIANIADLRDSYGLDLRLSQEEKKKYKGLFNIEKCLIVKDEKGVYDEQTGMLTEEIIPLVTPHTEREDVDAYNSLLVERGILPIKPPYDQGTRKFQSNKIIKAYKYIHEVFDEYIAIHSASSDKYEELRRTAECLSDIANRVMSTVITWRVLQTPQEISLYFHAKNAKGKPLSDINIVKGLFLKAAGPIHSAEWQDCYDRFQAVMAQTHRIKKSKGKDQPSDGEMEAFLLTSYIVHYQEYESWETSFPFRLGKMAKGVLVDMTDALLKERDRYEAVLENLEEDIKIYSKIVHHETLPTGYGTKLREISFLPDTQSFALLIMLIQRQTELELTDKMMISIIHKIIVACVWRSCFDFPRPAQMEHALDECIRKIDAYEGKDLVDFISDKLLSIFKMTQKEITDKFSQSVLWQNAYQREDRPDTRMRFILCYTEDYMRSEETDIDLWSKFNSLTLEHIAPQNLAQWEDDLNRNDPDGVTRIRDYIHHVGNITLTLFNSKLSNKPFLYKRDLRDGRYIGYKNGFKINEYVKDQDSWDEQNIQERGEILIKQIQEAFGWERYDVE